LSTQDKLADHANVMAPPPLVYGGAVLVGWGLHRLWPLPLPLTDNLAHYAGWVVMVPGLLLLFWAMRSFARARTAIIPYNTTTAVVAYGPYRFSRNPMYIAMALVQVGFGIMFATAWILILLLPVIAVIRYGVIAREEKYLERKFGTGYLNYKNSVRRWL
jgi:protein-S-isoprenylcysteine O-methyltransferase Ste14